MLPLLPTGNCPFCLSAYVGILSALGLGFLFTERVLLCLVPAFLAIGIGSIAWTLPAHGRRTPLVLAAAAGALIICGRLIWSVPAATGFGAVLFLAATAWNFRLRVQANFQVQRS